MKKHRMILLSVCLSALLLMCVLSGCGSDSKTEEDGLQIVTTILPIYDWTMNILGDTASEAEVTMLLDSGVDLHSFQPSAQDLIRISQCDLFIYVGGESDAWVADALKESADSDRIVLNLMDILGDSAKEEEVVEGMEEEEEAESEEGPEYDEHVWLSLINAKIFTKSIAAACETLDAGNKAAYQANAEAYLQALSTLDTQYRAAVEDALRKTILFGDRFPFRYLTDDYGISYYAAFSGCSAESEASFETIAFLVNKVLELELPCVLTLEGTDHGIAETIISTTGDSALKILSMDSMQSTTAEDVAAGAAYLSAMENNLSVLTEALH